MLGFSKELSPIQSQLLEVTQYANEGPLPESWPIFVPPSPERLAGKRCFVVDLIGTPHTGKTSAMQYLRVNLPSDRPNFLGHYNFEFGRNLNQLEHPAENSPLTNQWFLYSMMKQGANEYLDMYTQWWPQSNRQVLAVTERGMIDSLATWRATNLIAHTRSEEPIDQQDQDVIAKVATSYAFLPDLIVRFHSSLQTAAEHRLTAGLSKFGKITNPEIFPILQYCYDYFSFWVYPLLQTQGIGYLELDASNPLEHNNQLLLNTIMVTMAQLNKGKITGYQQFNGFVEPEFTNA